jgi:hypothetical protein
MNFSRSTDERDVLQRLNAWESLGHAFDRKGSWLAHRKSRSGVN